MSSPLRVMTYNIHSCVGSDRRYEPARILEILREIDADIVALQEVGGLMAGELEQAHYFESHLGMRMIVGHNRLRKNISFGNVLLMRRNIEVEDMALVDLSVSRFEKRGAIDCVAQTPAGPVRIVATHLGLMAHDRRRQIDILAGRLAERQKPLTLFLGDFNIFGPERRQLRRIGAPKRLPKLYSFPARRPVMSLDRIWTIPNECLVDISRYRNAISRVASDHLPLIATINIG